MIDTYQTRQILLKVETTPGTDAGPVGASDSMLSFDGTVSIEADRLDRSPDRPFFGADPFLLVHKRATVEFSFELIGNATVGNSAPIAPILKSCGMAEALSGGVSATYSFVSSAFTSATIYFYIGAIRCTMVYSMGTIEISQEIKSFNRGKATFTGVITNATLPTNNTVSGVTVAAFQAPPAVEMETWLVGAFDATLTAMVDLATLTPTPAASGGTLPIGVFKYYVTGVNAQGETAHGVEASATTTTAVSTVSLAWTAITGATSHNIYRTALGGATGTETLLATVGAVGAYVDTGAVAPNGVTFPPPLNLSGYRHVQATKIMLAYNNKVTIHEASELRQVAIMDRAANGTLSILEPNPLTSWNPWLDATNYTLRQYVSIVGKQPGKICTITMPNVQLEYAKITNINDAIGLDIPFNALPGVTTGNDELALKFT